MRCCRMSSSIAPSSLAYFSIMGMYIINRHSVASRTLWRRRYCSKRDNGGDDSDSDDDVKKAVAIVAGSVLPMKATKKIINL